MVTCHDCKTVWHRFRYLLLCALLLSGLVRAQAQTEAPAPTFPARAVLDVYVRDGCPHCADAKAFLPAFQALRPWLTVVYHQVDQNPAARMALEGATRAAGMWPPGVPTFVFRDQVVVGFADATTSGPELANLVAPGAPQSLVALQADALDARTAPALPSGRLPAYLTVEALGFPLFTLALGLLDGFNPCAMWILLFLLSLLAHMRDRRRMALISGTFVFVSGAIYYAFMAAWLNIFRLVGLGEGIRVSLALVAAVMALIHIKDFFAFKRGISLSIPDSAKPALYQRMRQSAQAANLPLALGGTAILAVMVNVVELLCTAGLPALYSALLVQQDLSSGAYHAYLGLYILGYVADDSLMVTLAVLALSSRKLDESSGRLLKLMSGAVMLALALVMLLRPQWLS